MDELVKQKIHVINDVRSKPEVLKGMSLDVAQIDQQKAKAQDNMQRAERLKQRIEELKDLQQETVTNLELGRVQEQEWHELENEMYRALQPFSMPSLQAQLSNATQDAEALSESLSSSFVESEDADLNEFIKSYRKVRKTYHLRKERLDRWTEERVGRPL